MTTKVVRFSEIGASDPETDDDEMGFVTKRTFELLEHEEPFLEKQFNSLKETAKEHCEAWTENLKEVAGPVFDVVEPIKASANQCVDGMMEAIRRSNIQELMLGHHYRPPALAMVGGPAPDYTHSLRDEGSLLSVESDEKHMTWRPHDGSGHSTSHERTSVILHDGNHARKIKPTVGILKQKRLSVQPETSMFRQLLDSDNRDDTDTEGSISTNSDTAETASTIETSAELGHPASTELGYPSEPSGKRPESPIKLFSSQELDEDDVEQEMEPEIKPAAEAEDVRDTVEDSVRDLPQGLNSQDPIIIDDYCLDENQEDTRDGSTRDRGDSSGEERDQPPMEDFAPLDFRPIAMDHHSHLPLSRTLLYSMRSRNRDIDSLLAELPTNYDFGRSNDELEADQASANGSSTASLENSIDSTQEFTPPKSTTNSEKKKFKLISFAEQATTQSKTASTVDYIRRDAAQRILELGL